MLGVTTMIRPANSPAQPDPVSRLPMTTISAAATAIAITDGMRRATGLEPSATQRVATSSLPMELSRAIPHQPSTSMAAAAMAGGTQAAAVAAHPVVRAL